MYAIDPIRLKTLRKKRKRSVEEVSGISGVSKRTIERYEGQGGNAQDTNVEALARTLGVGPEEITRGGSFRVADTASDVERAAMDVDDLERSARAEAENGVYELGVSVLSDLLTAAGVFEGYVYAIRGEVESRRPLEHFEAEVLAAEPAVGVRHLVAIPAPRRGIAHVTVHTREPVCTKALLDAWNTGARVCVHARVVIPRTRGNRVVIDGLEPGAEIEAGMKRWKGFEMLAPRIERPFALLVEKVMVDAGE